MVTASFDELSDPALFSGSFGIVGTTDDLQTTIDSLNQNLSSSVHTFTTGLNGVTSLGTANLHEEGFSRFSDTVELHERFRYICNIYVNPVICSLGLISNSLGIGVLWQEKKQQKLSIYFYLCALTLFDTCFLALGLIRMIPEIMKLFDVELANYINGYSTPVLSYIDMVLTYNSAGMILVMSFERLLSLTKPLTLKDTCFAKHPLRIIAFVVLSNILFILPFIIGLEVVAFRQGNKTAYFMKYRDSAKRFMEAYMFIYLVTHHYVPVICLFVTNLAIPIKYCQVIKRHLTNQNLPNSQLTNQQMKITTTVLVITILYLLLYMPVVVSLTLAYAIPEYSLGGPKQGMMYFLFDIGNLFANISAANDCLIYILASNHYREIFIGKYCRRCIKRSKYQEEN